MFTRVTLFVLVALAAPLVAAEPALEVDRWLQAEQAWERDTDGPVVSLGTRGQFDDTHIFAPMVARENDRFLLWYCGSRGSVAERVFRMGLATSRDGRTFAGHEENPVFSFGDGKHSILTPTLLRHPDGNALRENGRLRMWFSSTWFSGGDGQHTLHESGSTDGIRWSAPSAAQLEDVYSPTIFKDGDRYRMWFIDVGHDPWIVRHASSADGTAWTVTPEPCVVIDQEWESGNLFYPTVLKLGDTYQMWYGSYWTGRKNTTALGFAVSVDGLNWRKHPDNPVFRPDPDRAWESHYTTSQSIVRLPDGSLRIWYASRKAPPFVNKYFAINTAVWRQPVK